MTYDLPVCFVQIARVPRKNGAVSNNLGNDLSLEDLTESVGVNCDQENV